VNARAALPLAVVNVPRANPLDTNVFVEFIHGFAVFASGCQPVAGRKGVAGIEAHAEPLWLRCSFEHEAQVFETPPETRPLPRRVFQKYFRSAVRKTFADFI